MSVDNFNIQDVARIHNIEVIRERGGETYAVCPFCGDRRGKFSYVVDKGDKKKNIFKCWSCGEGGTAIDLHMKLANTCDYKVAVREIFEAINGNMKFVAEHERDVKAKKEAPKVAKKAGDNKCSRVYRALLAELSLQEHHKADLLRRGLNEEDIKYFGFKSVPKETASICRKLVSRGYDLCGVPGFYQDRAGNWRLSLPGSKTPDGKWQVSNGYFCPVYDMELQLLIGFQIRLDEPRDGMKYLWLSSSGKESGVSSGALATCLTGTSDAEAIVVTEGILKATIVYCLLDKKVTVIGIPGVKSIKSVEPYFERYRGNAFAFEAYDMDKAIRITDKTDKKTREKTLAIAEDTRKLLDMISSYEIPTHSLKWDMGKDGMWNENYKGLDDFLYAYDRRDLFLGYLFQKAAAAAKVRNFLSTAH